jgi:cytochrome c peroxidase
MKFVISLALCFFVTFPLLAANKASLIRRAAIQNGFLPPDKISSNPDLKLSGLGEVFFNSRALSLNGDMACATCHIDKFGSADGISNAIGVGGVGEGEERVQAGGAVVPRNTLPLWGRGLDSFNILFWDGKVDFSQGKRISQFGDSFPSDDPLIVSIHLPPVEIREMIVEDKFVSNNKQEKVSSASEAYKKITERVRATHPSEVEALAGHQKKAADDITFLDIAKSVAEFIRVKFALRETKFSEFINEGTSLSEEELKGAQLFYGKGKCSVCHSGPLFSDLKFHAVPFTQLGFGKNGFGIDYGRFNVTHDPKDLYKFRTPPLINVTKTAPYGHSGSLPDLKSTIEQHFDPLRSLDLTNMGLTERVEMYKRIAASSSEVEIIPTLSDRDVDNIISFLKTLEY